jgi:anti-anti-sigma factor
MTSVQDQLKVETIQTEGGVELLVQGELDIATAPRLLACFQAIVEKGPCEVVLDVSGLDFVDSAGLSLLVALQKRADSKGKRLDVRSPSPQLLRLLELTGLSSYFHLS